MSDPIKITGKCNVWSTSKWFGVNEVLQAKKEGETDDIVAQLSYLNHDMSHVADWVEIGIAEITVTLHPTDDIVEKQLEGLKEQLQRVRADNYMREKAILDSISNLQAITYTGGDDVDTNY